LKREGPVKKSSEFGAKIEPNSPPLLSKEAANREGGRKSEGGQTQPSCGNVSRWRGGGTLCTFQGRENAQLFRKKMEFNTSRGTAPSYQRGGGIEEKGGKGKDYLKR